MFYAVLAIACSWCVVWWSISRKRRKLAVRRWRDDAFGFALSCPSLVCKISVRNNKKSWSWCYRYPRPHVQESLCSSGISASGKCYGENRRCFGAMQPSYHRPFAAPEILPIFVKAVAVTQPLSSILISPSLTHLSLKTSCNTNG